MTDRISQRVERIAMVSEPLCPCQVKRSEEREFYLRMAAGQRWSVREVTRQASPRSVTPIVIRADVRVAATIAQLSSDGPQGSGVFDSPRRSQSARSRSISFSISFGSGRATK